MEKRDAYKRIVDDIKDLEQQLYFIDENAKTNEQCGVDAEREIELYFAKCEKVLGERKELLLRELGQKINHQRMSLSFFIPHNHPLSLMLSSFFIFFSLLCIMFSSHSSLKGEPWLMLIKR